jgi:hypothetical protein
VGIPEDMRESRPALLVMDVQTGIVGS